MSVATIACNTIFGIDDRPGKPAANGGGSGAGAMGGGGQMGGAGGSAGAAGGAGGAAAPALLVAVENLGQPGGDGDILKCPLAAGEPPPACQMLSPADLPTQPLAIAWIPAGLMAVASRTEVVAVHAATNAIAWTNDVGPGIVPVDIFALATPDQNGSLVAAAYENEGVSGIRDLLAFDGGGDPVASWTSNDAWLGSALTGMTQQPTEPSHLYAIRPNTNVALREVDTVAGEAVGSDIISSVYLRTIYALHDGARLRVAWVSGVDDSGVHFLSEVGIPSGPIQCTFAGAPCAFAHVVPDPTSTTSYLALCDHPGSVIRQVVRLEEGSGPTDACEVLYDSAAPLGEDWRLARLAVMH